MNASVVSIKMGRGGFKENSDWLGSRCKKIDEVERHNDFYALLNFLKCNYCILFHVYKLLLIVL